MTNTTQRQETDTFIYYPSNNIFGIIDDPTALQQVLEALTAAGFNSDNLRMFCGEEGIRQIDASGVQHGLLPQLVRWFQHRTLEYKHAERYQQAVHQGHWVIAVHTDDPEARKQAIQILQSHGGHFINFYGRWTVETLIP